ncbi:protein of unknown function (DUF2431) [Abeliophyllum distichum]|uniref:25S rRNA (uridine-N(3))-methyltransferase BMT5-like domain-containing protein n=1 Tax=Abeliophyllum distichum TaxID=126358 RepID=A0ABD1QIA2_9LAMI
MEERWIKHYSSFHRILLVGEGDFSFSLSLADAFGSASNIVASSLDSYDELITKYKKANSNLVHLKNMGAFILHGVDATEMEHRSDLGKQKFDRIIFNLPHAGFHGQEMLPHVISLHRKLLRGFFRNACGMLQKNGEIHVSHKTKCPYSEWKIEDLAAEYSLMLIECSDFKIEDYPGYKHKRGDGSRCDEPFSLGECSTFKFMFCPAAGKMQRIGGREFQVIPVLTEQHSTSFYKQLPLCRFTNMNDVPLYTGLTSQAHIRNECSRIFGGYLNHVKETFGRTSYDVHGSLNDAMRLGFEQYMREGRGRPLSGYIDILEELHHRSISRSQWLIRMLSDLDMEQ